MGEPDPLVSGQLAARRSWCLRRLGMDCEWLQLEAGTEVTIGRGLSVTYQLISKVCPLMISRSHCVLKLKTQMQEKQIAVLNVKRQTRKGSSKKIVRMEKELRNLQSQLYAEQAQQQARVEQLEKTFQEEAHYLQGLEKEQGECDLKQQLVLAPCLAPKNDQRMEKHKGSRTKRKFSSPGLENLPAEGSSDLRCPLANVASKPIEPEKLHGKGDASSQSLGCLCPGLTSLKASERAAGPHACSALPKVLELSCPKKQKACRPSASQNSLELFKVTMSRMLKLH